LKTCNIHEVVILFFMS